MGFVSPAGLPAGVGLGLDVFFVHFLDAIAANIFAAELRDIVGIAAEHAGTGRLVFAENDLVGIHVDFQGIFFIDTQSAAEFDRNNNTPQLINLANDSS